MAVLVLAAIAAGIVVALPPRRLILVPVTNSSAVVVSGVSHVHTLRSDGTGTPEEVAATAAQAGLAFIVFTDHGDGTRQPDPPQYRDGVLCIDAVEISTAAGHYIAIGIPKAPYPLAGEARDVVADVARLGGLGVIAHPDSAKGELRWQEWAAPFDAIEWLNTDSEWRDETTGRLAQAIATYPFRPIETLTALLDRPDTTLRRWDALTQRRPVVGLAGTDAHARVGLQDDASDPYRNRIFLRMPGYRVSFASFLLRVELEQPLTGEASADAASVIAALKRGRLYTAINGLAGPPAFEFVARSGRHTARQGEALELDGPITVEIRSNAPDGASIVLFEDGQPVAQENGAALRHQLPPRSTVLRAEIRLRGRAGPSSIPWIVSNPIYVSRPPAVPMERPPATAVRALDASASVTRERLEQHAGSSGTIERTPEARRVHYSLGGGPPNGQFVALTMVAPGFLRDFDRVSFRGSADRPMRLYVQLRRPEGQDGQRWRRSVYVDQRPRDIMVFFDDMTPIGRTETSRPALNEITDLLFVVDTDNTVPGQSGRFSIEALRLER